MSTEDTTPVVPELSSIIAWEDFDKVKLQFGTVLEAESIPKSKKLVKLLVDFGPITGQRTIAAGILESFPNTTELVGKQFLFCTNLAPRKIMGVESHGMILATPGYGLLALATPSTAVINGGRLG